MNIAFNDTMLEPSPTWTRLDNIDNLVASYTIDRGRQYETDRTDGGRATVAINDVDGVLDPTNGGGDYYGLLEPLLQVTLGRYNPVLAEWQTRFRGYISDYDYSFDPSQQVNRLTLSLVDLFEYLQTVQMVPGGTFGHTPPDGGEGEVWFDPATVQDRINAVYGNCDLPAAFYVTFTGNVDVWGTPYSPGESALTAVQEAAEAEFPGVSNLYPDRFGRMVFHGRLAKFDPVGTIAGGPVPDSVWDWWHWDCGDGAAVLVSPSTRAHIREFAFNRGLSQVVNSATATPMWNATGHFLTGAEVAAQVVTDGTSIGLRGIRSWSTENLLTRTGLLDGSNSLVETKKFADWRVDTHKDPRNRVTQLGFRSMDPAWTGAAINWRLLCECDISDQIDITVASPGGGGFSDSPFFIEGVHEVNEPLNSVYDNVTLSLDVSPADYNTDPEERFPTS